MTKLTLDQVDEALELDDLEAEEMFEVDDTIYRNSLQRKEIRTKRQREDGEIVGKGSVHKHRKF